MGLSPDKATPIAELVKWGMADILLRASIYEPPVGARGIQGHMKPVQWAATITSRDAAAPMVRAIRPDPNEALDAACERFLAIFRDKKKLYSVDEGPAVATPGRRAPAATKKAAPAAEDTDDFDDLI